METVQHDDGPESERKSGEEGKKPKHLEIFVDDVRYEVPHEHLTGGQIKHLAGKPAQYQLFLERPGHPDQLIDDSQMVTLKSGEHFHTVPPAQFG